LVEAHPASRVRTKIEVFDWLLRNEDKRVGKNPAGYIVASIGVDYQAPGDFDPAAIEVKAQATERAAEQAKRQDQQRARDETDRAQSRTAELRAAWERLSEGER